MPTDDFNSDINTTGTLNINESITGSIDSEGDIDWIKVSLQANRQYQIDLEGSETNAGTLYDPNIMGIYDSSGNLISNTSDDDSGSGVNSQLNFTPDSDGEYYIAANAYGDMTGTYKLSIIDKESSYSFALTEVSGGVEVALYAPESLSGTNSFDIQIGYFSFYLTYDDITFQSTNTMTSSNSEFQGEGSLNISGQASANGGDEQPIFTLLFTNPDGGEDTLDFTSTKIKINGEFIDVPYTNSFEYRINNPVDGYVYFDGYGSEGDLMVAQTDSVSDSDGIGELNYQWLRDGEAITDATTDSYLLTEADIDKGISVEVSYIDNYGTAESITSYTFTADNTNDDPTGSIEIAGTAAQGQTLTIENTLADKDGLSELSYEWLRDDYWVFDATEDSYLLTEADVGAEISVIVSYTDGYDTDESITSEATSVIANINDEPTGSIEILGTITQGETLTINNTVADVDGLGDFSYQWLRDGIVITNATADSYVLTEADVGTEVSVTASYTDNHGTVESVTSEATSAIININDALTGSIVIEGAATQGETLTVTNTLADEDGLGEFSYQWLRDGIAITDATADSYVLTEPDVDAKVSVTVSYIDNHNTTESITSEVTPTIENINDALTGSITIEGTAQQGETLTTVNTLSDVDGLGELSYQWLRDGIAINDATDDSYQLVQDDVETEVSVTVSYTDQGGFSENMTSDATTTIANINDSPTGSIVIEGETKADSTLTISNTLQDADGLGDFSYQWLRDGETINGATNDSYLLTEEDQGSEITVAVSYTDQQGQVESVSAESVTINAASEYSFVLTEVDEGVEVALYGPSSISGTSAFDIEMTFDTPPNLSYDNLRFQSSSSISSSSGAFGDETYLSANGQAYVNGGRDNALMTLSFTGSGQGDISFNYTKIEIDGEAIDIPQINSFEYHINTVADGNILIEGEAIEGNLLTVDTSNISDVDGIGELTYEWLRNGIKFLSTASDSYLLTDSDVDTEISVNVTFIDDIGNSESLSSSPTDLIVNVNNEAVGAPVIVGITTQGETLSTTGTVTDEDGIQSGTVSYQWQRDGVDISNAKNTTYTLTEADVGSQITVNFSYIDGHDTSESLTSEATSPIENINDSLTGTIEVEGTAALGETLTITNTLADEDGLGDFNYQWLRDGATIDGATDENYQLVLTDLDSEISVTISYTDNHGTEESITSDSTVTVTHVNDSPEGTVEILGLVSEGETLTITNNVTDADGLGDLSYQWLRNGEAIDDATSDSYLLVEADLGSQISVTVSYTDSFGTDETVTSDETQAVVTDGTQISGIVQDGYVSGAAIYIDKNGNNLADADEATGLFTDENGRFSGTITESGTIMAIGGINTDTGLANNMVLAAPEGSGVISPITTLLESLIDNSDLTEEEAEEQLSQTLGLDEEIDLYNFDPLDTEGEQSGEAADVAVAVQKINVQLAVAATLADDTSAVMSGLAEQIAEQASEPTTTVIDLSDTELLNSVLEDAGIEDDVITAIVTANEEIKSSENLGSIANAQQEATTPEIEQTPAPSSLTYAETVQQAYVAYYGRPADPGGLEYWNSRLEDVNGNLYGIIDAYGSSEEFTGRYGSLSNSELIDTIYQQMFGREPDAGGKAYYLGELDAGNMTLQTITLNVLFGAQNEDLTIVNNKVSASNYFTDNLNDNGFVYAGNDAANAAKGLLDAVGVESEGIIEQVSSFFQTNNTLTGSWVVDAVEDIQESGVITFFDDNTFLYSLFNETEDTSELEQGSYTWDTTTGSFIFDLAVDNDTESGLSAEDVTQITRVANQLSLTAPESLSLSKLESQDSSIVGSWYNTDDTGNTQVISFMANGEFVVSHSSQTASGTDSTAIETSVEAGSYAWLEATGAFIFDVTYDSNGREGFSHSGANEIQLVGNQLQLTSDSGVELFEAC